MLKINVQTFFKHWRYHKIIQFIFTAKNTLKFHLFIKVYVDKSILNITLIVIFFIHFTLCPGLSSSSDWVSWYISPTASWVSIGSFISEMMRRGWCVRSNGKSNSLPVSVPTTMINKLEFVWKPVPTTMIDAPSKATNSFYDNHTDSSDKCQFAGARHGGLKNATD